MLEEKEKDTGTKEDFKLEFKDIIAMIIAQFQILMPYMLIVLAVFILIAILLIKLWVRS